MGALERTEARWDWTDTAPPDPSDAGFLNHLRFVSLGCRAKARTDLFEACALLSVTRTQSFKAHAEALVLCLNDALGKQAVFFRPGVTERSFDESWLVRLSVALSQGDESSAAFLLHSRIAPEHHRHIRFLIARMSENFSQL